MAAAQPDPVSVLVHAFVVVCVAILSAVAVFGVAIVAGVAWAVVEVRGKRAGAGLSRVYLCFD